MKICFYNWVAPDDPQLRGGGVTVYQKNIMQKSYLISDNVSFISSGVYYRFPFKKVFYTHQNSSYKIYNSKALAPAIDSYTSKYQIHDESTESIFIEIIERMNGLDILHFNNFEGIPICLLKKLKEKFPKLKLIYSVHNYYAVCPNVSLWKNDNENCKDYNLGKDCANCGLYNFYQTFLTKYNYQDKKSLISEVTRLLKRFQYSLSKKIKRKKQFQNNTEYFKNRRIIFIDHINKYIDKVICVSKRVEEICLEYGINKNIIEIEYIGTEHVNKIRDIFRESKIFSRNKKCITMSYLGYMWKNKGFNFFLNCLEQISDDYSKKINLIIAAKNTNQTLYDQMNTVAKRFNSFVYYDGFDHKQLDNILVDVDLGIIPPIWEDNLPQIAIELHCRKIPLLCSDAGGASELHGQNENFIFVAGSVSSFVDKLKYLLTEKCSLTSYWNGALDPISMETHLHSLKKKYRELLTI